MKTKVSSEREGSLLRVIMENEFIRAVILPELGGKVASLVSRKTGREFFLQHPDRPYRRASYADAFGDYDISGFDECLPTVSACVYPEEPFAGAKMPDHGEVWSLPWKHCVRDDELILEVAGICLPYVLRRTACLRGSTLDLDYEIVNSSDKLLKYLWSAHPLLAIEVGAEIILPPDVSSVLVDFSVGPRFAVGSNIGWPKASNTMGKSQVLNWISGPEQRSADKFFTPRLNQGYCGVRFPSTNEQIVFRFEAKAVPYIGLWICQGGFPAVGEPEFTMALEPCTGRPDSLASAISSGECRELPPQAARRWSLRIEIQ